MSVQDFVLEKHYRYNTGTGIQVIYRNTSNTGIQQYASTGIALY